MVALQAALAGSPVSSFSIVTTELPTEHSVSQESPQPRCRGQLLTHCRGSSELPIGAHGLAAWRILENKGVLSEMASVRPPSVVGI